MKSTKILAMLLACVMVFTLLGVPAFAEEATNVAQIGDTPYTTLKAAFENAQKGDTIELLSNVTITEQITVADNDVLSDLTIDGNTHTIFAGQLNQANTSVFYFGNSAASIWCTGVKIQDLTIDVETARFGIFLCGGTSSELINVTVKGDYVYGINLFGTRGATMTNCDIVSIFTNAQDDYPLNLVNTKVGTMVANVSDDPEDAGKVTIDANSNVTELKFYGEDTSIIASGLENVTTVIKVSDDETEEVLADTSWYNSTDASFTLTDKADLYGFATLVNSGNTFAKKTVKLADDIDLANEEWTPIGDQGKTFSGVFDGGNHTISNVYISERTYANVGFFGHTSNGASIENLKLHNVDVTSTNKAVGAVVGDAYTGTGLKNVSVTGKIAVSGGWYVGGINGGMSYVGYENCVVDGSNSEGFKSYVKATVPGDFTNYVGGICGQAAEGGKGIHNCSVKNIDLIATDGVGVGGICGVLQYDYIVENCSVTNVQLIHEKNKDGAAWTGTIAGKDYTKTHDSKNNLLDASAIINCEASGVTASVVGEPIQDIFWMGHDHTGTYPPYNEYEPQAIIGTGITYDESGKINGGTLILVGNNDYVKDAAKEMLSENVTLGAVQEDGSYSVVEYSFWTTATDAGYYLVGNTPNGVMRFLFAADVDADKVTASGIKYIKASNITEGVTSAGADGKKFDTNAPSNAFYGDVYGVPDEAIGNRYYAVAYIQLAGESDPIWSDFVECSPNFDKLFTNYQEAQINE